MKITIIGAGNVGRTLGAAAQRAGHRVTYLVRDTTGARALTATGASITPGPVERDSDLVMLATPADANADALRAAGDLTGMVLVDCTNPLKPELLLSVGFTDSGGEQTARLARGARVVKAFNTIGYPVMASPTLGGRKAFLPVVGDDAHAKARVIDFAKQIGFDAVDAGPLIKARLTEPFAALWISLAYDRGFGPDFAFSLIRR